MPHQERDVQIEAGSKITGPMYDPLSPQSSLNRICETHHIVVRINEQASDMMFFSHELEELLLQDGIQRPGAGIGNIPFPHAKELPINPGIFKYSSWYGTIILVV